MHTSTTPSALRVAVSVLFIVLFSLAAANEAAAQADVSVYATGLKAPIGVEIDAQGRLWVAEQGTGNDDSRISVVTADGMVHPFIDSLRSSIIEGDPEGAEHVRFVNDTLVIAYGLGSTVLESYVLRYDTTGYDPANAPLRPEDADETLDVGAFTLDSLGFAESSVYNVTPAPDGHVILVDASGNALLHWDVTTGELGLFATFEDLVNPLPVGPPGIQPVPTSALYYQDRLLVTILSGFPFVDGLANIYEVGPDSSVSVFREGFTLLVDMAVDPRDSSLVVLEFGRFDLAATSFVPNSGNVLKLRGEAVDTLASGLNTPAGMRFNEAGELFVTSVMDGEVWKIIAPLGTAAEDEADLPEAFRLLANYPNPFNPSTMIQYELAADANVVLRVYDVLGRPVRTLVNARQAAGARTVAWDGRSDAGDALSSGVYLYRMEAGGQVQSRKMLLVQ